MFCHARTSTATSLAALALLVPAGVVGLTAVDTTAAAPAAAHIENCQRIGTLDPIVLRETDKQVIGVAESTCVTLVHGVWPHGHSNLDIRIQRRWGHSGSYRWVDEGSYQYRANGHNRAEARVGKVLNTNYRVRVRVINRLPGKAPDYGNWIYSPALFTGSS